MQFTKRYYLEALFQRKPLHPFEVDWSPVIDAYSWKCPPNMYEKKKTKTTSASLSPNFQASSLEVSCTYRTKEGEDREM